MAEQEYIMHKWLKDDTIKIKLMKMSKGNYQWELTYETESVEDALKRIGEADTKLREQYGDKEA